MKILFVIPSYKPAFVYGGPIVTVSMLAESITDSGENVTVFTTTANGAKELDVETGVEVDVDGVRTFYYPRLTGDHTHVSPALWWAIWKRVREFDVVSIHSWWSPAAVISALVCRLRGVRPIVTPHGMFCDYVLTRRNGFAKKLIHHLLGRWILKGCAFIATSPNERKEIAGLFPDARIAVLHNLVRLPDKSFSHSGNDVFTIGFLSRIQDKKGIEFLFDALALVDFDFELHIAGDGEAEYIETLKMRARRLGISDRIKWVGWKNGDDKFEFLAGLDLFALTSINENFAVVVVESLAVGTPVLLSKHVGLSDYVAERDLGWISGLRVTEIAAALSVADSDRIKRARIRQTASSRIAVDFSARSLVDAYQQFYLEGLIPQAESPLDSKGRTNHEYQ